MILDKAGACCLVFCIGCDSKTFPHISDRNSCNTDHAAKADSQNNAPSVFDFYVKEYQNCGQDNRNQQTGHDIAFDDSRVGSFYR